MFPVKIFKLLLLLVFLSLFAVGVFLSVKIAKAQVPPPYIPCEKVDSPEFHSLRPYQASPCNQEPAETARFCGNRLVLSDTVTRIQTTAPAVASNCTAIGGGRYRCTYSVHQTAGYEIDLSEANFPILGNTEDVINSQSQSEGLDDAEKTNQYVSWYLNGVTGRAEYPPLSDSEEDIRKLVDFSGPIKKLLPQSIQHEYQIQTIEARGSERHNQIVLCADEPVLGIGKTTPVACYKEGSSVRQGNEYRLSDWDGDLSFFNKYIDGVIDLFTAILPDAPRDSIREYIGEPWNERVPPLPWDDQFSGNSNLYLKAYNEWRGKSCVLIPVINQLVCIDNPFVKNKWADLFPYIPMSSTEDRVGEVAVDSQNVTPASEGLEISNVNLVTTPAELFFSHTEEVSDLASILQLTFVPEGLSSTGGVSGVAATEACDLTTVRSNKGDSLFAKSINGTLNYDAEFSCDFDAREVSPSCSKDVSIGLGVVTQTPKADDLWSRLVAGSSGIFKRIFPKIDANMGPIGCLLDIPGATGVVYSGSGLVSAGNPGARSGENAELYFPHVGGISEYFLKGIQTILRPKGFGETIAYGAPGDPQCVQNLSTDICSGDCNPDPTSVDMSGVREKFMDLANRWLGVGSPRTDKYDQVVNAARARGVDPIFTLAIWLHESGASNYFGICQRFGNGSPSSGYCQRILDFGVNRADLETVIDSSGRIITDNFTAQLNSFLNLPGFYISTCGADNASCPLETFGAMYRDGSCSPSGSSNGYVAGIKEIYGWLAPGQQFPCYPSRVQGR